MSIDYNHHVSRFVCRCCYPDSMQKTLNENNFLEHGLHCELVIVDMCNCVSPWTKPNIVDLFYLLGTTI